MRILIIIARVLVGFTFIFSGFVKAVDPLGSAYKFHDYFQAFNLGFLDVISLPLGILLCTAEFIAGFAVLSGIKLKTGIRVVILLMAIFTPLTLILALTNPVSDCGCFGDAIQLTNWQTFWKNVVIVVFAIIVFINRKKAKNIFKSSVEWVIIAAVTLLFILFSQYNLRYLPVIDFLPYKTGVKIADKMLMPEGVAADEYHTTFIYEKDGIQKEFELNNYPADDTTWRFIDQKSVLVKKGYQPPIHDFAITSVDGDELTQKILSDRGYSVLMVSVKLAEAEEDHLSDGFDLGRFCMSNGIAFYVLTSSGTDELKNYDNGLLLCSADEITLKSMVRSNPGYLLLKDGIIIGKWSWANLPGKEWFEKLLSEKE
jgi:uncharacterized membrane protein YphA (DoxX/SURF4 family)